MKTPVLLMAVLAVSLLCWACPAPLPNAHPTALPEVNAIRDDGDLTPQEKRAALAALGFAPTTINALLRDERLANQFGGDLRSAYDKVTSDQIDALTPDEIQAYGDGANEAEDSNDYTLDDAEAQVLVDFFDANAIQSEGDLVDFLDDPAKAATVPTGIPEGILNDLFIEFDPDALLEVLP